MDRDLVGWLRQQLQEAQPDLLREMLATMVQELMGAEAQQLCGAEYGERSSERSNSRNGYRERDWDTRAGSIELAVPKLALRQLKALTARARRQAASKRSSP